MEQSPTYKDLKQEVDRVSTHASNQVIALSQIAEQLLKLSESERDGTPVSKLLHVPAYMQLLQKQVSAGKKQAGTGASLQAQKRPACAAAAAGSGRLGAATAAVQGHPKATQGQATTSTSSTPAGTPGPAAAPQAQAGSSSSKALARWQQPQRQ